jgi:hypothetical protein
LVAIQTASREDTQTLVLFNVMAGLDPAIHAYDGTRIESRGCAGQARA